MKTGLKSTCLFALGIDERVFDDGVLREKAVDYGREFAYAYIVSKSKKRRQEYIKDNVRFHAIYSPLGILFTIKAILFGARAIVRNSDKRWLLVSDNPFETGIVVAILSLFVKSKILVQVHTDFLEPYFRKNSWKEYVRYLLGRVTVRRADFVRVVSERIKTSLEKTLGIASEKIIVMPIVTDIAHYANAVPDPRDVSRFKKYNFVILSAGRFVDKEKNFFALIEMMRIMHTHYSEMALVLVGDGPDKELYESKIRAYGLEGCVIMEPWRSDLSSLYKACNLFILPSYYEGWGCVVIEAMAAGLPVIMTDVGLAGEVVVDGENGIVLKNGNADDFADAVSLLYNDRVFLKRISNAGRETVASFSIKTRDEYFKKYKEMLIRCSPC